MFICWLTTTELITLIYFTLILVFRSKARAKSERLRILMYSVRACLMLHLPAGVSRCFLNFVKIAWLREINVMFVILTFKIPQYYTPATRCQYTAFKRYIFASFRML